MSVSINELICKNSIDRVVAIGINRPDKANSLSPEVIVGLTQAFEQVSSKINIRAVVLFGHNGHFCAGADLEWMKACGQMDREENYQEALKLAHMFDALSNLNIPTIALVTGSAFGGGVGLLAACDFVIADSKSKICLSEAKLGILPSVITPHLLKRITSQVLVRLTSFAPALEVNEANRLGLIDLISTNNLLENLQTSLNMLLTCSPDSKGKIKHLIHSLTDSTEENKKICAHSIADARMGGFGQNGLASFLQKNKPIWHTEIDYSELERIKSLIDRRQS